MMHTTQYLYGVEPKDLEGMEYFEALNKKKKSGERLFRKLFLTHSRTEEEEEQMFYVKKAHEHTEILIGERTA